VVTDPRSLAERGGEVKLRSPTDEEIAADIRCGVRRKNTNARCEKAIGHDPAWDLVQVGQDNRGRWFFWTQDRTAGDLPQKKP
jgi:hypothetical protein